MYDERMNEEMVRPKSNPIGRLRSRPVPLTPGLFKELPFFKYEPVLLIAVIVISFFVIVAGMLEMVEDGMFIAYMMIVGFSIVMFLIKQIFFLPTGKKIFIERVLESGGVHISVANPPKDNVVEYSKNRMEIPPTRIERYNKHFEVYTGKPYIKTCQGQDLNYSVNELFEGKTEKTAQEVEALIEKARDNGYITGMGIALKMKDSLKNPMSIILVIMLALMALVTVLTFLQFGTVGDIAAHLGVAV